ncbi:DUF6440 family protein [Clostridium tagluense]|uniref:DUF6440 family protein n=1 Tax=Clostridium tagluense TaxID=360422 RepID=UPI001C0AC483|nr:DUF6440 family protein [Clostridium tagluense]MBU3126336.1 hypothetical protein [Clostridium tagluense]MCB2298453.1 DUF6440 family protein [Clostridium tagluense]MCB2309703.1 DUF6440 family protein [Clostridium tagluense]MCB2314767.1 DUF6440 family protein [Clostridium tagluense]MCB2319616.1 DUF6440 family protein [Clostridium tagluense]
MFNKKDKSQNNRFKAIDDYSYALAVTSKIILDKGTITNYLINIKDYAGAITILLDKNGNTMFSQVKL